ncbi:MAG TPA: hypothetical protein VG940_09895 [Gemmatimonadales bacterium]|nr:hypothetical protein [Gemmatimonadales bacterium]
MRRLLPIALAAALACGPGEQPPPPAATLRAPADTVTLTDTEIADAVWLGGDRWAVLVPQAHAVRIVDFATHRATPLGRPGRDYAEPFSLFRAGDTLYVGDWGMRRVTGWSADGRLVSTLEAPAPFRGALPRARDAAGAWYAELRPRPGADGSGNRDSGVVVRWRAGTTSDTVATLVPYEIEPVTRDGARRYERLVLSGADQWGVDPDGTLWIARVNQNALERCAPAGACRTGPRLRDKVLEVTLEDREYFLQSFPEEHRSLARDLPFAIIKPPFTRAFGAGQVTWLELSRMLTDSTRSYRLLDTAGVAVQEFRLPNAQRILGATADQILAIDPLVPGPGHRVLRYAVPR